MVPVCPNPIFLFFCTVYLMTSCRSLRLFNVVAIDGVKWIALQLLLDLHGASQPYLMRIGKELAWSMYSRHLEQVCRITLMFWSGIFAQLNTISASTKLQQIIRWCNLRWWGCTARKWGSACAICSSWGDGGLHSTPQGAQHLWVTSTLLHCSVWTQLNVSSFSTS